MGVGLKSLPKKHETWQDASMTFLAVWATIGPFLGVVVGAVSGFFRDMIGADQVSKRELQARKEAFAVKFIDREIENLREIQDSLQRFMYAYDPRERTSPEPGEWHEIRARVYMLKYRCAFPDVREQIDELLKLPQPLETETVDGRLHMTETYKGILETMRSAQDQLTQWMTEDPAVALQMIVSIVEKSDQSSIEGS